MPKLQKDFKVVIPKEIRDHYGIVPGDEIYFRDTGREILLTKK